MTASKARVSAENSTSQSITANTTNINFGASAIWFNDELAFDGTTFTVLTDRDIEVSCSIVTNQSMDVDVYINGAYHRRGFTAYIGQIWNGTFKVFGLKAGDLVTFRGTQTSTVTYATIQIAKVNYGYQQIAAVEKVIASYNKTTSQGSITTNTIVTNWDATPTKDTHGIFNPTTGVATLPPNRSYLVIAQLQFSVINTGGQYARIVCSDPDQTAVVNVGPGGSRIQVSTLIHVGSTPLTITVNAQNTGGGDVGGGNTKVHITSVDGI
jgi:hypothetical protein